MKLEYTPNNNKESKITPRKLEEIVPFIKFSEQEMEYVEQSRKSIEMFYSTEITRKEALDFSKKIKENEPPERKISAEEQNLFQEARTKLIKSLGYTVLADDGEHLLLEKNNVKISLYHNPFPSVLGFENGRILQATVTSTKNNEDILEFYSGKNVISTNKEAEKLFYELVNYLN
jgi:hypothetical protein